LSNFLKSINLHHDVVNATRDTGKAISSLAVRYRRLNRLCKVLNKKDLKDILEVCKRNNDPPADPENASASASGLSLRLGAGHPGQVENHCHREC
jgi:hypothetical protein